MGEYDFIINEHKKCRSFTIANEEGSTRILVSGRKGLVITNLVIYNSSISKGTIELYVTSDIADKEIIIAVVEAGQTFQFADKTGLTFWSGSEVYAKIGDNVTGNIFIGYIRSRGQDYSVWSSESIGDGVNMSSVATLTKRKSIYKKPGYWDG